MTSKIILSLAIIGIAGVIGVGATTAYFSDTETSVGNTFTAGTIDISIDGENPWTKSFTLDDMKPCYTDYINFRIDNDLSDPNPVNIFKRLYVDTELTGAVTEPECTEQHGEWVENSCAWGDFEDNNELSAVIWYDLNVEVYDGGGEKVWYQTIYVDGDEQSIAKVYDDGSVYLGMIPSGGYMLVEQSYHLNPDVTNWAQGDVMTFDIEVKAEQLHGTAWLENKRLSDWKLLLEDDFEGELTYKVKHPTFDFEFDGRVDASEGTVYVLAAGMKQTPTGYDVDTYLGEGVVGIDGSIAFSGDIDLGKDMKDVKVWLVPASNWDYDAEAVKGWNLMSKYLWETGLIWYEDTNIIPD